MISINTQEIRGNLGSDSSRMWCGRDGGSSLSLGDDLPALQQYSSQSQNRPEDVDTPSLICCECVVGEFHALKKPFSTWVVSP